MYAPPSRLFRNFTCNTLTPLSLTHTLHQSPANKQVPTGDQPEDVEEQIRAMCYEFTSNPNAIILAVTAANQDLVNSDGLST